MTLYKLELDETHKKIIFGRKKIENYEPMDLIPIKVVCHSGYKADEYPIHFYWHNQRFEIKDILDRWYQLEYHSVGPAADYYKICTTAGEEYIIKHEHVSDSWFLIIPTSRLSSLRPTDCDIEKLL